jgi:AraC-like DNA-binding protein
MVRLLEWAALRMFQSRKISTAGICHRFKYANPVEWALLDLQTNLDVGLDLTSLAKKVGIAPHLLSRRVSQETGKPLQLHLRKFRIHRACEESSSGKKSISEMALDVGYNSLSHFAQAFRAEIGCSPSEWMRDKSRDYNDGT